MWSRALCSALVCEKIVLERSSYDALFRLASTGNATMLLVTVSRMRRIGAKTSIRVYFTPCEQGISLLSY